MVRRKCKYDFRFDLSLQIQCTYLHTYIVLQGRRKWAGKVGNYPPRFGRSVNPIVTKGGRFCPTVLLTHPALGSFLRPCQFVARWFINECISASQGDYSLSYKQANTDQIMWWKMKIVLLKLIQYIQMFAHQGPGKFKKRLFLNFSSWKCILNIYCRKRKKTGLKRNVL